MQLSDPMDSTAGPHEAARRFRDPFADQKSYRGIVMKYALPLLCLFATSVAGAAEWDAPQNVWGINQPLTAHLVGERQPASPLGTTDTLVFDSFTGANAYTTTSSSPRTFMGLPINVDGAAGSNPSITRITFYLAYTGTVSQTYQSLRIRFQLWDGWGSTNDPVFSTSLSPTSIDADISGPITLNPNTYSPITVALGTPVPLSGLLSHGIAVNFQGDTGSGLASADALTSLLRYGATPLALGANALPNTYGYRNVTGRTDFNFAPTDARSFGQANEAMVFQMFAVPTLLSQAITDFVANPAAPIYSDGSFTVSATGGASGNPVTFSVDAGSASVCSAGGTNGSTITILATGTCTVLADQAGNATYSPAPQQSLAVQIGFVSQSITNFVANPAAPVVADGSFTVSATGGASGNPVTFSIDPVSASVCSAGGTNGSTITILSTGTCTVLADQAGDAVYSPAPQQSLAVQIAAAPGALVQDGGFEAGFVPTYWTQTSTNFGTPLCNTSCGGVGPRTGNFWAWFGGAGTAAEAASVQQSGFITIGPKLLTFYVWWSSSVATPPDPSATFDVLIDGTPVFSLTPATAGAYNAGYTLASVDISTYADGNSHTLRFQSNNAAASGSTNIQLDDINIVDNIAADTIFADGFEQVVR